MNNLKRNLLIGFGASLIILIVSSTASFISISNLLQGARMVNHTHEVIIKLDALSASLIDAETGQRGYLLTGQKEFLQPYLDAKSRAMAAFHDAKSLTSDNSSQQLTLEELKEVINSRFEFFQKSIDAKQLGNEIKAEDLQSGRMIMDEIRRIIKIIKDREEQLLEDRTASMNRFASFTPILIVVAALIALLITVLFYARVQSDFAERTRLQLELQEKDEDITRRIGIIRNIADQISQGSYDIRVDDKQSDSLGNVAGSLNKMAESLDYSFSLLSDKEWTQTGVAKLNDVMIGELEVQTLTADIISFLAAYTNSNAGAVYLAEDDQLVFSSGYAYAPKKERTRFKLGETLIGQAAISGKLIELRNVPPESIYISYATGEAKATHIIAIPVLDGKLLKGVIELATLKEFTKRDIEYLSTISHNIGIAISTAQNRKRLQELLEETQSQSEELKAQHSELENINSELEVQSEELQASEEQLKVQQEELKEANHELEERSRLLEERNQLINERNVEIKIKADQLETSAKYKSEFLANMSHELRTPLNSILLLSRLMSENKEENLTGDQVEYAKVIQSSGNGLLSLIDEILDLSKIEAGKMQLEYQHIAVAEIINDMTSLFNPIAKEKGIEFKVRINPSTPDKIETDKMRLEQIIKNLLSNALKFTTKGSVELSIAPDDHNKSLLKISISDSGIGIAKEKQDLVFEAFQQADGSTRRRFGGTGLGLSISRELAKLLGGEIRLKSEIDKGSVFTIYVPVTRESILQNSDKEKEQEAVVEKEVKLTVEDKYISTTIPQNIPDDRFKIQAGDKVMLIVEDDVNFAKSLLDYTRQRGYKGIVAVRGDEGVALAKEFSPLGILLDIQLPIKSGWEVMEDLKGNSLTKHIPVHIMSSHEVKNESLLKGAVDFINKPVAFDQLQDVFKKIEYVLSHHPKKVLIVEENSKHAKALAYFLETFEISLDIKSDIKDAIQTLKENTVDCVILDMGVPDQKAYDTLETVKKTAGLENLPIIIFTGKSLSQAEEMRIRKYADSIVVKTAHSYKRLIDEVSLFLHMMEKKDDQSAAVAKYHKFGTLDEVLRNKTVLVVDDDMRNIFSLTKALENYQMKIVTAVDGKEALRQVESNSKIDIVLMDMMMPEMDGYDSTAAIRRNPKFKSLPIIAVTAKAMMGDREKCINAGASDYITKPVDIDQLLSLLRVWLYEKGLNKP
ncbi:MAG: response regulator [Cyclobacteriaceae bacterium]|nr:response regulator [Cyclobacteriaceae bacterium]